MANAYRRLVIHCFGALICSLPIAIAPALAYDWLQFGGNPQHSGNNSAETILNPGNVASLVQKYQITLQGIADGTPVFLEGVTTPSGVKDLLFVTTHNGGIVALDAQSGATAWSHQYGPGTCQINNSGGPCYTTSSPAIDPNRLYVYSYGLDGNVHKYQVGDGTEIMTGGWPQLTTFKGYDEKGSSALSTATSAGTTYLYVTHGGYPGDNGDYQGHVTAINLATGSQNVFNAACSDQAAHLRALGGGVPPTCATRQNAMWSRPGVIYDAGTDRIFIGTGNAFNGTPGQFDGNHNWSESVIALHPDGTGGTGADAGKPLDSYTPTTHASLDLADADVGSTAPAILPVQLSSRVQHLAVQGGKDATLRLLNLQDLSGRGSPGNIGGEVGLIIDVPQGGVVLSQPAVWVNPADNSTWIFVVNGNGASALRLNFDTGGNPLLSPQWQNGQSGTSPVIANNMVFSIGGSSVRALDPVSGNQLWSAARGGSTHWQSLIVANGAVYATDQASHLAAFVNPSVGVPPPPTAVTATPGNARAIVSFTPSASDGGSPILNYTTTSSPNNITGSCSAPCTSINVIGLTNGTAYTFTVTATNAIGTGAASAPSNSVTVGPRQRDNDGDGKGDLLWRNGPTGQTAEWLMNGLSPSSSGIISADSNWTVTHTGDLNGDGKTDLIWRNTSTGQTAGWLMNGLSAPTAAILYGDPNWAVINTGDFNGDGKADLVWRNTATGQTAIWLMNGLSATSSALIYGDPNWVVTQVGDFNGDGKADLLWRNTATGQTAIWLMNGLVSTSSAVIYSDPNWVVLQAADFDGDGKTDLLWRNTATGQTAIWLMNGLVPTSSALIYSDPNWMVTQTGDFNGDGKADLLWRNTSTGQTAIWLMNGLAPLSSAVIYSDPTWAVSYVSDLSGDGKSDLVWRNAVSGQTAGWLMNGLSPTSSAILYSDPNWAVLVPGGGP